MRKNIWYFVVVFLIAFGTIIYIHDNKKLAATKPEYQDSHVNKNSIAPAQINSSNIALPDTLKIDNNGVLKTKKKEENSKKIDATPENYSISNLPKYKDYDKIFIEQAVDPEWSILQTERIRLTFDTTKAYERGILLQSVECRTSICLLTVTNFDSSKESVSIRDLIDVIYDEEWSYDFHVQTQGDKNDEASKIIYLIDDKR